MALAKLECHQEQRHRYRQARIVQGLEAEVVPLSQAGASVGHTPSAERATQSPQPVRAVSQTAQPFLAETQETLKDLFGPILEELRRTLERAARPDRPERPREAQGQRGFPSKDRPCVVCGSAEHWAPDCSERKKQHQGNGKGLNPGSRGQSRK